VQHLTGTQAFRRIDLRVRPGVFIPRPETEIVVGVAIESLDAMVGEPSASVPVVVYVGTGTGAIALALKEERPRVRVFATDASAEAVALARENAEALGLVIDVRRCDLFDALPLDLRRGVDLVVSNPPYVTPGEHAMLAAHVRADPDTALIGGDDTYRRLFDAAGAWLRPGGRIVVEIGAAHAAAVGRLAAERFDDVVVRRDLAGRDRVVAATARPR
jgi:release factor glutamine methyltransferase